MEQGLRLHKIWIDQCDAARTIRIHYGADAAFDYLVGEKLMNFADAAITHPKFKDDLPMFVSEVRAIFSIDELAQGVAKFEKKLQRDRPGKTEFDELYVESPKIVARRIERFKALRALLTAPQLGTA